MATALVYSRAIAALATPLVCVEVHLSHGLPAFHLVGLPEAAVREAKDRVRSAIINSHFEFPSSRITINLSPADLPKTGGRYDLAIALGILAASKQINTKQLKHYEFIGELALTGELRAVTGSVNAALASQSDQRSLVLPWDNGAEAALAVGEQHFIAQHLLAVCAFLNGEQALTHADINHIKDNSESTARADDKNMADIKGQKIAKRALEIAAAGQHNLLMSGPPGCGKSMLAERLPSILPPLSQTQALEHLAIISSMQSHCDLSHSQQRPFRSPHHSSTMAAMVGGGKPIKPGEITLAHHGVLFLDELPEFQRPVLNALREPLETREIAIARASEQVSYPASFQLIAAMNPCPCGHFGNPQHNCQCSTEHIRRYTQKISGPLLDRFDLHLALQPTAVGLITSTSSTVTADDSSSIRARVNQAHTLQQQRQGSANSQLSGKALQQLPIQTEALQLLETLATQLRLSARGLQRTWRVARTIADLAHCDNIENTHITEACSYRLKSN